MNAATGSAPATPGRPKPLASESWSWLAGDASERRYARLVRPRRYELPTAVAMLFPKGTPAAEVARVERATRRLAAAGVPVPAIHDSDPAAGWILQEDLGDRTLAQAVAEEGAAAHEPRYDEALGILDRFRALGALDTSPPPLDAERLSRELAIFAEAALPPEPPGPALRRDLERLVEACCAGETVLCHRDYHARNLMLHSGRLRVIDHQDAMGGPAAYDRVSLAYDPYVELPAALRDRLAGDEPAAPAVAVQRLCKAIGTYAGKGGSWRRWIAPAAREARRLAERHALRLPVLQAALGPLALATP